MRTDSTIRSVGNAAQPDRVGERDRCRCSVEAPDDLVARGQQQLEALGPVVGIETLGRGGEFRLADAGPETLGQVGAGRRSGRVRQVRGGVGWHRGDRRSVRPVPNRGIPSIYATRLPAAGRVSGGWLVAGSEPRAELGAGVDPELAVYAREVGLDGLGADERGGSDLAIGQSRGGEPGDSLLGRGQLVGVWCAAEPRELIARMPGPQRRPDLLAQSVRVFEGLPCLALLLAAALWLALDDQGARGL